MGLIGEQTPLEHSLFFEQIWNPVHAAAATQVEPLNPETYSYEPSVVPPSPQPGWAACSASVPEPQQIVPAEPTQSGVPSQCQSVSVAPHAVAVGVHAAPAAAVSQQCSVPGVQLTALPPSTPLNGQ